MRRVLQLTLAATMLLAVVAGAAGPPAPESDQLDYVFVASDKPVLIRLHLRIGDKPYDSAWKAWSNKMFAWFDRNNDGVLDASEVARVPQSQVLSFQLQGSIGGPNFAPMPMSTLDTNKDGKVTKDEFRAFFPSNGMGALRFFFDNSQATNAKRINDAIYKRLDKDSDGKLTIDEFARLPQVLRQLDEDEDEYLTGVELNTEGSEGGYGVFTAPRRMVRGQPGLPSEPGLLELKAGSNGSEHLGQFMTRYDRNKDGKIARNEIAFDANVFDELDTNKDGLLEQKELVGFFAREPDLIFRIKTGSIASITKAVPNLLSKIGLGRPGRQYVVPERIEILNPKKRDMPIARAVKKVDGENVSFALGDSRFQLQGAQGLSIRGGFKGFYLQEWEMLAEKKDHVAREQERTSQQRPFLFQHFTPADKNADNKLTKRELSDWLDLLEDGMNGYVSLNVNDQGRSLFDVMDANADNRLSIRETRMGWERAKGLVKAENHGLVVGDLPRTLRITAAQGQFNGPVPPQAVFGGPGMMMPLPASPGNAPAWFRKMDRNGDGDLSPREWLGTEEDFKAMDLDGDGLISGEEARKYVPKKEVEK